MVRSTATCMRPSIWPTCESLRQRFSAAPVDRILSAQILLHEPFARPGSYACISAYKILSSSRTIVELLHGISATSFDVSSLDLYPYVRRYLRSLSAFADIACTALLVHGWKSAGAVHEGGPGCSSARSSCPSECGDHLPSVGSSPFRR